jgi:hypothetical protein
MKEILTANDQPLQQKCHTTEILQTETDNKCKTFTRQHNTLYQHDQYWHTSKSKDDVTECELSYTLIYAGK